MVYEDSLAQTARKEILANQVHKVHQEIVVRQGILVYEDSLAKMARKEILAHQVHEVHQGMQVHQVYLAQKGIVVHLAHQQDNPAHQVVVVVAVVVVVVVPIIEIVIVWIPRMSCCQSAFNYCDYKFICTLVDLD